MRRAREKWWTKCCGIGAISPKTASWCRLLRSTSRLAAWRAIRMSSAAVSCRTRPVRNCCATARSFWATSFREPVLKNGPIRALSKKRSASSSGASSENVRGGGRSSYRSSWRSSVAGSTFSRRVSEFAGVALFGAALIWLIALATYEPTDPVWFFSAGSGAQPANFAGRVGAFLAELSFQVVGYGSYLLPAAMVILGWHYFWCRSVGAQYSKLVGAGLL